MSIKFCVHLECYNESRKTDVLEDVMLKKSMIVLGILGFLCGCSTCSNFTCDDSSIQESLCSSCCINDTPYNPDCDLNRNCEYDVDP